MESFAPNSRCVEATLRRYGKTALCLPIACVVSDQSLWVQVEGTWRMCSYEGQQLQLWWDDREYVTCPDPWRTCPTFFCPGNCLGTQNGVCDFATGDCLCDDVSNMNVGLNLTNSTPDVATQCVSGSVDNITFDMHVERSMASLEISLQSYYVTSPDLLHNEPMSLAIRFVQRLALVSGK